MRINRFPDLTGFCEFTRKYNVVPVWIEMLADTETPVSILEKYYDSPNPVFLLESADGGERWGRYSFLGISAKCQVKVFSERVEFQDAEDVRQIPHHGAPLEILKDFLAQYVPAPITELPRFWGGLVGYLTYESVSFFESIPHQYDQNKPMAHFVLPDELIIFDNVRHTLFCVVLAFVADDQAPETLYQKANSRIEGILKTIETSGLRPQGNFQHAKPAVVRSERQASYQEIVKLTKQHIHQGDIIQAVMSQSFVYEPAPDPWYLYRAQRFINPSPYLYFIKLGDITLVGSSPETMVRLENGVATLRPIAGTRPRGQTEKEDRLLADELLKDEKEKAEHLMLVDLGRNDLGRIAETGSVQVTDLMIVERYSHVMHMVSNICCDLQDDLDAWDLLEAVFPAGTLTGAPKVRAMELISKYESDPRGAYGGAVGYIAFSGNMDLAITIRTACIESNQLSIRAGAGIVADSDPDKEYEEAVNKAKVIQKAMQMIP
jgi:anthranilate synthase component 1